MTFTRQNKWKRRIAVNNKTWTILEKWQEPKTLENKSQNKWTTLTKRDMMTTTLFRK